MEIKFTYYGRNSIQIKTKKKLLSIDPNTSKKDKSDVVIYTDATVDPIDSDAFVINSPGEYEIAGATVAGFAFKRHIDSEGQNSNVYSLIVDEVRICIIGNITPELKEDDYEAIGTTDILFIPVGGHGLTLDSISATKIAKSIGPKIVVPTHFDDSFTKYEIPQDTPDDFIERLGITNPEKQPQLSVKASSLFEMPGTMQAAILETQES